MLDRQNRSPRSGENRVDQTAQSSRQRAIPHRRWRLRKRPDDLFLGRDRQSLQLQRRRLRRPAFRAFTHHLCLQSPHQQVGDDQREHTQPYNGQPRLAGHAARSGHHRRHGKRPAGDGAGGSAAQGIESEITGISRPRPERRWVSLALPAQALLCFFPFIDRRIPCMRTKLLSLLVALALALGVYAQPPASKNFDGKTWWDHVKILADDSMEGRETGSEGLRKAEAYVVEQLTKAGLQPAGTNGYYQPVKFVSRQIVERDSSVTLVRNGTDEPLTLGEDTFFSTRVDLTPEEVTAPLVFVKRKRFVSAIADQ